MKKPIATQECIRPQSPQEAEMLERFFVFFDAHCLLQSSEKRRLRADFEKAILHYLSSGLPLEEALRRLDIKHLGGFYARPPVLWFPLDDAAKIYPLSMAHGKMAVFRLSVYLRQDVVLPLLQMALNFTIKRFPSFATTLKKGFFWHYLDTAKRRFTAEAESDIPCQPLKVSASGSQSFRLLCWKNRISLEFFHVLTDGSGGLVFLKALTGEYLRLCGVELTSGGDVWNVDDTPAAEEFENAFARVPLSDRPAGFMDKPAVQMNGRLSEIRPCRVIHFRMDAAALAAAARCRGATVTAYMLALMFLAGKAATDELRGEAAIQVPVNMRKFYPSATVRNFAMYCGVRLPLEDITDADSITAAIDAQLRQKASRESMVNMLTATEKLVDFLKYVPLAVKQPIARRVYGFLGDSIFSNTLSNLGLVSLPPEMEEHMEGMDFVLGAPTGNRASCALVTACGTACLSITKTTADPSFEEKLYELLCADGIPVRAEGSVLYGA